MNIFISFFIDQLRGAAVMSNSTNSSNIIKLTIDLKALDTAQNSFYGIFIVLGVPINLWFLVALLRSPEFQARLRNKLVSSLLVAQLLETGVIMSVYLIVKFVFRSRSFTPEMCSVMSLSRNLTIIQDFIANWTVVLIVAVFLAQVNDFDLSHRLTPLALRIVGIGLPAIPWFVSLLLIPIITKVEAIPKFFCVLAKKQSMVIFKSLDCIVPILAATVLLAVAAFQKRRRYAAGSGVMKSELIGRGPQIDSVIPYVVIVSTAIVFDSPNMTRFFGYPFENWNSRIIFVYVSHLLVNARSVVMPAILLLLPDVRERIKTWRPWYRPAQGIDLTVGYTTEQA
ncbi:uncharacterized protein LOC101863766 [Aplysia californica]|uniref:Uncharacterized protein LOC101863766 n=1 Tax=Aplysia californica TaxID=6500 RepID=A0ABM1A6N0_APLCA|nr:uncharacterized protein LOC101863766 [Aplysia californica]